MMGRHFQKRRLIVYTNIIKDRRDHSYDAENLTCDEVTERKDYIRMDQEIIRTLGPKIICSACQKFANFFLMRKKPNEHYSFEAEILHFSA